MEKAVKRFLLSAATVLLIQFSVSLHLQAAEPGSYVGFSLETLDGKKKVSLKDFEGKIVYLDFWASWCGPCKQSLPELNKLYAKYKDKGFEVVAVNLDENKQDGIDFLKKVPVDYTVLFDKDGEVATKFDVQAMPSSVLIDQFGVIQVNHKGFKMSDIKKIEKAIKILMLSKNS